MIKENLPSLAPSDKVHYYMIDGVTFKTEADAITAWCKDGHVYDRCSLFAVGGDKQKPTVTALIYSGLSCMPKFDGLYLDKHLYKYPHLMETIAKANDQFDWYN